MSDVPLLIAALESGDLPPICVKTGETTRDTLRRSFTVVPGWTSGILILFGVLPWLMARAFTGVTVHAVLPMSEPAYRRLRAAERSAAVAILVAIASFAAAAGWDSNVVAWVGMTLLVAGLVAAGVSVARGVGVIRGSAPDRVVLTRVSAEFAMSCGRREGRAGQTIP